MFEIKKLSINTKDGKNVASDINIAVSSGQVCILMGANGSGKSSIVNAVLGYPGYIITNGSIIFNDENITKLPTEKKAKKGIFLAMQYIPEISGVTALQLLHKGYQSFKDKKVSILDFYNSTKEKVISSGMDIALLERELGSGLSGGEKKQLEAIGLLCMEPKIAILDEIDSGVDADSIKKVFGVIDLLKKTGTGFLLITHYPNILSYIHPDCVYVMREGKIVASGGRELVEKISRDGFVNIN